MQTIAIIGVGLIGGSFGLALRRAGFTGEIIGVSSPGAIDAALTKGAITSSATLEEAAQRADLIYLSQTVDRILQTIDVIDQWTRKETLITDAGSTKTEIVARATARIHRASFLGGHPMAGKESRGAESADADLFHYRPYVLTPTAASQTKRFAAFRSWLEKIGCHILEMTPADHDRTVAFTSHLAQIASTALAATLDEQLSPDSLRIHGSGLKDMTRLALSPADVWRGILDSNQQSICEAIDAYIGKLQDAKTAIQSNNLNEIFDSATELARNIRKIGH